MIMTVLELIINCDFMYLRRKDILSVSYMEDKAETVIKLRIAYFLVCCPNHNTIFLCSTLDNKEDIIWIFQASFPMTCL